MSEPINTAVTGAVIATGAITLTGSIFGMQYDALLFGMFGGLISLMHLPAMTLLRLIGTLGAATLLGAIGGPIGSAYVLDAFDFVKRVPGSALANGSALMIGISAQGIIGFVLHAMDRFPHTEGKP